VLARQMLYHLNHAPVLGFEFDIGFIRDRDLEPCAPEGRNVMWSRNRRLKSGNSMNSFCQVFF
jgi:hypothetical protein